MNQYAALLRGVNVGGKNKLPMKELSRMFSEAGCEDVRTYIQSGNVVFRADADTAARIPERIASQVAGRFGYRTPVVLRNASELKAVIANNPFLRRGEPEDMLHVLFLAGTPPLAAVASLDRKRSPPDEFVANGQDIYLYLPNGAGKTKLTNAYFDSKLSTISTGRNWRTVNKLLEMMD